MISVRHAKLFGLFAAAYFLSYFFRSANAVIAGDLARELSLSAAQLGLMTSLFYATFAAMQLPLGILLDRFGPRFVTSGFMLMSVVGCLLFASAESFALLALGRALIGAGMGGVLMGAFKAFGEWFPNNRVATISGFLVGIGALGGLAAATPLAWLNAAIGWRTIFGWGALVILASALALVAGVRNTPTGALTRPSGATGGITAVFGNGRFWPIAMLNFFIIGVTLAVQSLWGGSFLFDVRGLSQIAVGNVLLAIGLGVVAGYFACGWLADRYGAQQFVMVCAAGSLLAQSAFLFGAMLPLLVLVVAYVLLGFTGSCNIVLIAQMRSLLPSHLSGRAVTAVNLFGFAGVALLQWWMGLIISQWPPNAQGQYPPAAYAAAFLFTGVGTGLALVWYALPRRSREPVVSPSGAP